MYTKDMVQTHVLAASVCVSSHVPCLVDSECPVLLVSSIFSSSYIFSTNFTGFTELRGEKFDPNLPLILCIHSGYGSLNLIPFAADGSSLMMTG